MITAEELAKFPDTFNGDDARLVQCIEALLSLDATGALVPHGIGGHARRLLSAAMHRLATQSRAARVQGASDGPLSSRLRPDVECAPWVIEEVKKLERRLATPRPPKDAGAVPELERLSAYFTETKAEVLPDPAGEYVTYADTIRYGNAREAAGRADSGFNLFTHLLRQREWSERTFGPGDRTAGVVDHIRKELVEVESAPGDVTEWIDIVILALDGAWRAGHAAETIIDALQAKQAKNESRTWPDWRTAEPGKAIEHDRSGEAEPAARAQVGVPSAKKWVDENGVEVTAEWMAGWDACRVEYPRAHPSPAHAGAGADALARKIFEAHREQYRRTPLWPMNTWEECEQSTRDHWTNIARRLAGGDRA